MIQDVILFIFGVILIVGGTSWALFFFFMTVMSTDDGKIHSYTYGSLAIAALGVIAAGGGVWLLIPFVSALWSLI
jgi:hypothetical protein